MGVFFFEYLFTCGFYDNQLFSTRDHCFDVENTFDFENNLDYSQNFHYNPQFQLLI